MTYHVLAQFDVPAERRGDFTAAALFDAQTSLATEQGTLRFEVIHDEADPNRFYLDEVYTDRAAFDAHCQGEVLKKFYELVPYATGRVLFKGERIDHDRPQESTA
ncbi:putative quinol monooxygenase [Streptomyces sp. NPDC056149]|uniref:putative quinol monooxygenase n=1 Tax=Streptomyces sp. NPDC056149 TaxID=3345728 RepID=UPI0035DB0C4B